MFFLLFSTDVHFDMRTSIPSNGVIFFQIPAAKPKAVRLKQLRHRSLSQTDLAGWFCNSRSMGKGFPFFAENTL